LFSANTYGLPRVLRLPPRALYSETRGLVGACTQAYDEPHLDAANLPMEHHGFIAADDPHYVATVERSCEELCRNGMMYRYRNTDDFGTPESSFIMCTFWMVQSLWRIGQRDRARRMFDDVLRRGNHVGLFGEDMDFKTGRLLGNFPQAYSHLALIDAAINLAGAGDSAGK
jgi:alpha,alpha-trehalase